MDQTKVMDGAAHLIPTGLDSVLVDLSHRRKTNTYSGPAILHRSSPLVLL